MRPIPRHLLHLIEISPDDKENELYVQGILRCPCGSTSFNILYSGQTHNRGIPRTAKIGGKFFFVIRAICLKCNADHLLLDKDFHGWDGFVCRDDEQAGLPRPKLCLTCHQTPHKATIQINSFGRDDFINQAGDEFSADD